MSPKISIIVPVYNVENYIQDCINSILKQDLKEIELILVNDGSTDNSGYICDEFSKKDRRIKVIHKENGGQSSARNRGIEVAEGDFIGFVDSDDWIEKEMYETLYAKAMESEADIVACNISQYTKDSSSHLYWHDIKEQSYDKASAMKELYLNERLTFSPCNKIYKKELFVDIRFKEGYILEDMEFAYRIMHLADKVYYIGKPLYNYRYNESSTMRKTFTKKRLDEFEVRKNMYYFYLKHYPDFANELYAEWFLTGLLLYINIEKYYPDEKAFYKYLIDLDRTKATMLVMNKQFNKKKKLLLSVALISPYLLVSVYRMYWDKLKKEL